MNVGSLWFSDRIILKMTDAQPLTSAEAPELHRMTERLAERELSPSGEPPEPSPRWLRL